MIKGSLRPYTILGGMIAIFLLVTAGAGVANNNMYTPFLSESIVVFQFFQDLVSLVLAFVLVAAMMMAHRGTWRAFVIWLGILVYAVYYYAFYVFDFVYTPYYPLYLAVVGLSAFSLMGMLGTAEVERLMPLIHERMPVRLISFVLGMTLLFVPIWAVGLYQGIRTQTPGNTDLVFVFDLAFLIPACLLAAVQIWRRKPIGYLLCGPLLFKSTLSGVLLTGGEMLKMQRGLPPALDQLSMYLFLAVVGMVGLILYLRNIAEQRGEKASGLPLDPLLHKGGW